MSLCGFPDFNSRLEGKGYSLFKAFGSEEMYYLLPQQYKIPFDELNVPALTVEFTRLLDHEQQTRTYGVLDMMLQADYRSDDAILQVRSLSPRAYLVPLGAAMSIIRLYQIGGDTSEALNLHLRDCNLAQNAHIVQRLSATSVSWFRRNLNEGILPLAISAALVTTGVAARFPATATIAVGKLINSFRENSAETNRLGAEKFHCLIAQMIEAREIRLETAGSSAAELDSTFSAALIDKLVGSLFDISVDNENRAFYALLEGVIADEQVQTIDLSVPSKTKRFNRIEFNPFATVAGHIAENGPGNIMKEIRSDSVDTGQRRLEVYANLPENRKGIVGIGVNIEIPSHVPFRFQRLVETIEFNEPEDKGVFEYRVAPGEKEIIYYTPYVMVKKDRHVDLLKSPIGQLEKKWLDLSLDKFPVGFKRIAATTNLLGLASIEGEYIYRNNAEDKVIPFRLSQESPLVSLAQPLGAEPKQVVITVRELEGDNAIVRQLSGTLEEVSLFVLPEYGPHKIRVTCELPDNLDFAEIEFKFNDGTDVTSDYRMINFTRRHNQKELTWFARSPFYPGFYYRQRRSGAEEEGQWSQEQSAHEDVLIDLRGEHL